MNRNETGAENAQRFANAVIEAAQEHRFIVFYADGRPAWPWMSNAEWRLKVRGLLDDGPVEGVRFHEPDNLDPEWSFSAYSAVTQTRVQTLSLDDKLEPGLSLTGVVKANRNVCWWCIVIAAVLALGTLATCTMPSAPAKAEALK
jgi:hypothetical protein